MKVSVEDIHQKLVKCSEKGLSIAETAEQIEDLFYDARSVVRLPINSLLRLVMNDNHTLLELLKAEETKVKDLESDIKILSNRNANLKSELQKQNPVNAVKALEALQKEIAPLRENKLLKENENLKIMLTQALSDKKGNKHAARFISESGLSVEFYKWQLKNNL